jgi:hypothetical protein
MLEGEDEYIGAQLATYTKLATYTNTGVHSAPADLAALLHISIDGTGNVDSGLIVDGKRVGVGWRDGGGTDKGEGTS